MSSTLRPARSPNPLVGLLDRLAALLFVIGIGVMVGLQYLAPNKRVISVLMAVAMFGLTWRLDLTTGLGVMALGLPFPRAASFGNTNLAFILLMLVTWLLRVTLRQSDPPHRSPIDVPLITLFICYVVSLYNVDGAELKMHLDRFQMMAATWLMFYLVVSIPQSRKDFEHLLGFQAISVLLVCLVGIFEVTHPGQALIPSWIEFKDLSNPGAAAFGIRVGSSFHDYELFCEYCAIQALLILFLLLRADSILLRTAYGALLTLVVFMMFATVTRGGVIALGVGILYLLWLVRRRLTMVGVTITAGVAAAGLFGMNWFVATFTRTGNMFERLSGTTVTGFVPDNRLVVWPAAWNRIFEHPFLGHGPYYSMLSGAQIYYWPHSVYLCVANNVGFIGFAVFMWLLWTLFRSSRPTTDDLRHPDSVRSYMIIARAQMVVFLVDEIKIEYLRNDTYSFQVWMMFALMAAAHRLVGPSTTPASPADARGNAPSGQRPSSRSVTP